MERYCDLHTHSVFSDGSDTPAQLIAQAERLGLSAIALCDHNTIAGLPDFLAAAEGKAVEAIPGIEFSTDYHGTELHILALYLKPEHYGAVNDLLAQTLVRKEQSNRTLVAALRDAGYDISYDEITAKTPLGHINRAHIASELTEKGYTASVKEAFRTLLSDHAGFYHRAPQPESLEVIRFIKSMGAAAVLAHPFLSMQEPQLRAFLPLAAEAGLDAMETLYATYDEKTTACAKQMAAQFHLLESGGSDYHGIPKPDIAIGIGRGNLRVPAIYAENLRAAI